MKTRYFALFIAASSIAAPAQDLVKEIDVDRTIVPAEREAARPSSPSPSVFTPKVKPVRLTSADLLTASAVTPLVSVTGAGTWGASQPLTPYRGYISGGYMPVCNLGLTAGYQLVGNRKSQLGAWAMYNGDSHKYEGEKYSDHFLRFGLGGSHSFSSTATLQAGLSYHHDTFTTPFVRDDRQGASIFDARVAFLGKAAPADYNVNAGVLYLGFADPLSSVLGIDGEAMKQLQVKVGAGSVFNISGIESLRPGLDVSFDYLHSNNLINPIKKEIGGGASDPQAPAIQLATKSGAYGIVRFDPYVLFSKGDFEGRLGLNLSVATCDQSGVRVAPNVAIAYRPRQPFAIWATVDGGMGQNRIYDLYERDYTTTPPLAMKSYNIPVVLRAGIDVGPFSGFRASVHAGYAIVRDMAIPWLDTPVVPGMTTERKLDGLNAGIDLSYAHRFFTVKAGFEAATSSDTDPAKGWYLWRDRARRAFSASIEVRPIAPLTVSVGYEGRYGRHTFAPGTDTTEPWTMAGTRDISSLNLGAKYVFTPALTFFVRAENILNHRYFFSSTVPAPGFTGLLGAEYKF